jgi:hypothetical protein
MLLSVHGLVPTRIFYGDKDPKTDRYCNDLTNAGTAIVEDAVYSKNKA